VETAQYEPINEEDDVACDEKWQSIYEHRPSRITCWLDITTVETCECEYHQHKSDDKHHEGEVLLYCKFSHVVLFS
jgi:hypothetical protein